MYNLCEDFQVFYDNHVRLGKERRQQLADFRDLNVERIKRGLMT
jgi:hypothetical protein